MTRLVPRSSSFVVTVLTALGVTLIGAGTVSAQSEMADARVALHGNGAFQSSSETLRETFGFRAYGEEAVFEAVHDLAGGAMLDIGGFVRVWSHLSVGATYTQVDKADTTVVTGRVPHPIQFSNFRVIEPQTLSLSHRERAVHVGAAWLIPVPAVPRLDIRVSGGPSYFNLAQGVVVGVAVREAGGPPFASVIVDQVVTGEHERSAWGAHVGVDAVYMVTRNVGLGAFVRIAQGSIDLPVGDETVSLAVGGVQAGGGLRVRF